MMDCTLALKGFHLEVTHLVLIAISLAKQVKMLHLMTSKRRGNAILSCSQEEN